jgi:hypothetical protein
LLLKFQHRFYNFLQWKRGCYQRQYSPLREVETPSNNNQYKALYDFISSLTLTEDEVIHVHLFNDDVSVIFLFGSLLQWGAVTPQVRSWFGSGTLCYI